MKKIIIRNHTVPCISSKIIDATAKEETLQELEVKYGIDFVLKTIFDEKDVSFQKLKEEYNILKEGGKSEFFSWIYLVDKNVGISVDEHIYLYHFYESDCIQQERLFPWRYTESKKYLGDAWWFSADEILRDVREMPIINFFEKYRGY